MDRLDKFGAPPGASLITGPGYGVLQVYEA